MTFDFNAVLARREELLHGAVLTLEISLAAVALSFLLGVLIAIARLSTRRPLRLMAAVYIDVFRNTPFLVQLFFLFYGLPELGIATDPVITGTIALSLTFAANNAEIVRAGIETVPNGVVRAAQAFAFSSWRIWRSVILPIALRTALPPLGSSFVNLVLTTSVLSTITVADLMGTAQNIAADSFRPFESYVVVMLLYFAMTLGVAGIVMALRHGLTPPALRHRSGAVSR